MNDEADRLLEQINRAIARREMLEREIMALEVKLGNARKRIKELGRKRQIALNLSLKLDIPGPKCVIVDNVDSFDATVDGARAPMGDGQGGSSPVASSPGETNA